MRIAISLALILIAGYFLLRHRTPNPENPPTPEPISYQFKILPILKNDCARCHQNDPALPSLLSNLSTTDPPIVIPGHPESSPLWLRLTTETETHPQPDPHLTLAPEKKETIRQWIKTGAIIDPHWADQKLRPEEPQITAFSDSQQFHHWYKQLHSRLSGKNNADSADSAENPFPTLENNSTAARQWAYESLSSEIPLLLTRATLTPVINHPDSAPALPDAYENWLLQSFSEEKPYDEILTRQLAGDLLPQPSIHDHIATHYLRTLAPENRLPITAAHLLGQKQFSHPTHFTCPTELPSRPTGKPLIELPTSQQNKNLETLRATEKNLLQTLTDIPQLRQLDFENWLLQPDRIPDIPDLQALYPLDQNSALLSSSLTPPQITTTTKDTTVTGVTGVYQLAAHFDGTSHITLPHTLNLERHLPFTLAFWIKTPEPLSEKQTILASTPRPETTDRGLFLTLQENTLQASLTSLNTIRIQTQPAALHPNRWTHLALTYDGSATAHGLQLYIDGALQNTHPTGNALRSPIAPSPGKHPLYLGGHPSLPGVKNTSIDDLHIYTRALTEPEIHHLCHGDLLSQTNPAALSPYYFATQSEKYRLAHHSLTTTRQSIAKIQNETQRVPIMASAPEDTSRLTLAHHLFSEKKERLARVLANRLYHTLTGTYLCSTPNDFTIQGEIPTHPGLLDHYAHTLIHSGWDLQTLCREIILTAPISTANIHSQQQQHQPPPASSLEKIEP